MYIPQTSNSNSLIQQSSWSYAETSKRGWAENFTIEIGLYARYSLDLPEGLYREAISLDEPRVRPGTLETLGDD